jgi:hypothetical protein
MPLSAKMRFHETVRITNDTKNGNSRMNRNTFLKRPP